MSDQGLEDVIVTVGGAIPAEDIAELKRLGVVEVFTPGASAQAAIDFLRDSVAAPESALGVLEDSGFLERRLG